MLADQRSKEVIDGLSTLGSGDYLASKDPLPVGDQSPKTILKTRLVRHGETLASAWTHKRRTQDGNVGCRLRTQDARSCNPGKRPTLRNVASAALLASSNYRKHF
eukprot:TRINITY_DN6324_c0_g4_i1.p1 TRINITY_DN6324_c0_g4~~TRINITY_DN6324_c0_g4_i1.p1  ORF type:complete len:105 (-),score=0.03 TRINITY_DN6324_c0_g4_i1:133-447(-)